MYEKTKSHMLHASVSNLFDNLDILVEDHKEEGMSSSISLACVNQFEINFLHSGFGTSSSTSKIIVEKSEEMKSVINQAKWCRLLNQHVFVVANYEGVLVYDSKGEMMMFWHGIQPNTLALDFNLFCRGIACVDSKYICVGSSKGQVFIITPHKSSFHLFKTRHDHDAAITSLASTDDSSCEVNFVSADDKGSIFCYNFTDDNISNISQTSCDGIPCTSVKIADSNMVIAGYMTGYINIINPLTGLLMACINAHARILTSLDVIRQPATGDVYAVSVGEDSYIRMWEISSSASELQIKQVWNHALSDVQPCGVKFCDNRGDSFLTSCYDTKEVLQFSRT